jgi:hypothetical protein
MNHFASRGERFSAAGVRSIVVRDLALRLLRRRVVTIIAFLRVVHDKTTKKRDACIRRESNCAY